MRLPELQYSFPCPLSPTYDKEMKKRMMRDIYDELGKLRTKLTVLEVIVTVQMISDLWTHKLLWDQIGRIGELIGKILSLICNLHFM